MHYPSRDTVAGIVERVGCSWQSEAQASFKAGTDSSGWRLA